MDVLRASCTALIFWVKMTNIIGTTAQVEASQSYMLLT